MLKPNKWKSNEWMFNSLKQESKDASHEERQTTTFDDENPVKNGKENQACNCGARFRLRSVLACVAARLSRWRKLVCVITNKSVFWALDGCTILYNRLYLPYDFLHSNETRDWLAYLSQSSPYLVSMFWFCTWDWEINNVARCTYSLLGNLCTRMQCLHQENS